MNEISTQVVSQIAEYNPIAAALASVEKYRGLVCDVTTPKGMAEAKAAQREVGALRIALDKTRKQVKADVLARGKLIDGEANRILDLIAAIEDPIKKQIDAEERKAEEARQAAILAEQQRLEAIERERKEAEERRLADDRAKLERERAEFELKQVEARHRREADEKEARERIALADAEARARREAEEAKLAAERRAAEDARRMAEDEQRKLREAQEAQEREARRKAEEAEAAVRAKARAEHEKKEAEERSKRLAEQMDADAHSALQLWFDNYGHLKKFKGVAGAIGAFLKPARAKKAA